MAPRSTGNVTAAKACLSFGRQTKTKVCSGSSSNGGQSSSRPNNGPPVELRAGSTTRVEHPPILARSGIAFRAVSRFLSTSAVLQAVVSSTWLSFGKLAYTRKLYLSILGNWSCQPICFMYESTRLSSGFLAGFKANSPNWAPISSGVPSTVKTVIPLTYFSSPLPDFASGNRLSPANAGTARTTATTAHVNRLMERLPKGLFLVGRGPAEGHVEFAQ